MNSTKRVLCFAGMPLFIGIDIHLRQWTITIKTSDMELKTFSMNPSPQQLHNYLTKHYPGASYFSVYEAGFCGFWAHRELVRLGINNIVVNPADVPTSHKEKTQKQDKRDSRKLASQLAGKELKAIYVPSAEKESLRLLARRLLQISKSIRRSKTRIKHFLHTQGIKIPRNSVISHWSARFILWLKSIEFNYEYSRHYLDDLIADLQIARSRKLEHLRKVRKLMKDNKIIHYLRTAPGVGFVTAFVFFSEIIDMKRFKNSDHLMSYIGIIPSVYGSDKKEHILGLTNRCNKYLRYLLIEASWIAVRKDPALTMAYHTLLRDKDPQKAIIQIAKKLVNRMRYVWQNQTEYVMAVVE